MGAPRAKEVLVVVTVVTIMIEIALPLVMDTHIHTGQTVLLVVVTTTMGI